jgi:hypothetical protein
MTTPQPVANTSPNMLKQCRHGPLLFLREDMSIGRLLDLYGEFSNLEAKLFAPIVCAGDVVVEVDANVALRSLFNVYTHHAGVGSSAGELHVPPLNDAAVNNFDWLSLSQEKQGESVPLVFSTHHPLCVVHDLLCVP